MLTSATPGRVAALLFTLLAHAAPVQATAAEARGATVAVLSAVPAAGVGAFAGVDVSVANMGAAALAVRSVRVDGDAFAVEGALPASLEPGASATLRVSLAAQVQGTYAATLVVETDDGTATLPVEARRVERLYVDAAAPGGDGATWATAFADLTGATGFADGLDGRVSVWVRGGTYRPTGRPAGSGRAATFVLREGVALLGGFSGTGDVRDPALYPTVLSGDVGAPGDSTDNAYAVVTLRATAAPSDSASVDGVTVTGGVNDRDEPGLAVRGGGITGTGTAEARIALAVRHSAFASNYGVDGGGVACDFCSVVVSDAVFRDNRAQYGGGLSVSRGAATVRRSAFERNETQSSGGGAHLTQVSLDLSDLRFIANVTGSAGGVGSAGGGLYVQGGGGRIARVAFERNQAPAGGGASVATSASTRIDDVVFDRNVSQSTGGGLRATGSGLLRIANARFVANTGGGLSVDDSDAATLRVRVSDSAFEDNVAGSSGGAADLRRPTVVSRTRFVRNRARSGGALTVAAAGTYVADSEFLGNTATGSGAQSVGGAVVTFGDASLTVVNSVFVGNRATGAGSVLTALSGATALVNVTMAANGPRALSAQIGGATVRLGNAVAWPVAAPLFAALNPGAPGQGGTLAIDHAVVQGGATGTNVLDADPRYGRPPAPGPDGAWGTPDDDYGDLRVQSGSPAIDAGRAALLPPDTADLDGDGNTAEPVPTALGGDPRARGAAVDLGAYESEGAVAAEPGAGAPRGLRVSGANPARAQTVVSLDAGASARAVVVLYDLLGRRVAVLHDGPLAAGRLGPVTLLGAVLDPV